MINIYTFAHKRPDFIELQLKSFKKHLADDFNFIVFNNASFDLDKKNYNEIHNICRNNGLTCIDMKVDKPLVKSLESYDNERIFDNNGVYFNAVVACAYPLCYAWRNLISENKGLACIIDSDMFYIKNENISEKLSKYDLLFLSQSSGHVKYMWNGILYMNLDAMENKKELNWWCGRIEGQPLDVGGHTYHYLNKYSKNLKIKHFGQEHIKEDSECDFFPPNYEYIGVDGSKSILHYRGGSNWDAKTPDYHDKKTKWLIRKLDA